MNILLLACLRAPHRQAPSHKPKSLQQTVFYPLVWGVKVALLSWVGVVSVFSASQRFEFTQSQMGVPFRMVLFATDERSAKMAANDAFATVRRLNQIFSDYEPESELNQLSAQAGSPAAVPASEDLWAILKAAQDLSARSNGAFDVTVGPYVKLWRNARMKRALPEVEAVAAAREKVGWRHLCLEDEKRAVKLVLPGMRLDVGGIGKGYAVDKALATLRGHGITQALVAAAGDIAVSLAPPGKKGWRIELPSLDGAMASRFVMLTNAALSTSGDTFQRLELNGKRYSHIVDPRTGIGLTDQSLVTVIANDSTTADSLATAVSVLGPGPGMELIESVPGAAVLILRQSGDRLEKFESKTFSLFYEE